MKIVKPLCAWVLAALATQGWGAEPDSGSGLSNAFDLDNRVWTQTNPRPTADLAATEVLYFKDAGTLSMTGTYLDTPVTTSQAAGSTYALQTSAQTGVNTLTYTVSPTESYTTYFDLGVNVAEMVAQVGERYYRDLDEALAEGIRSGNPVTVLQNVTLTQDLTLGDNESLTINLGTNTFVTGSGVSIHVPNRDALVITPAAQANVTLTVDNEGSADVTFDLDNRVWTEANPRPRADVAATETLHFYAAGSLAIHGRFNNADVTNEQAASSTYAWSTAPMTGLNTLTYTVSPTESYTTFVDLGLDPGQMGGEVDGTLYETIDEAIEAAKESGKPVVLTQNQVLSNSVIVAENETLSFVMGEWTLTPANDTVQIKETKEGSVTVDKPAQMLVPIVPNGVAQVGDTYYPTLEEAIAAAAPTGTVTLVDDVVVDETLTTPEGSDITLDAGDHTITGNGEIVVPADSTLTVTPPEALQVTVRKDGQGTAEAFFDLDNRVFTQANPRPADQILSTERIWHPAGTLTIQNAKGVDVVSPVAAASALYDWDTTVSNLHGLVTLTLSGEPELKAYYQFAAEPSTTVTLDDGTEIEVPSDWYEEHIGPVDGTTEEEREEELKKDDDQGLPKWLDYVLGLDPNDPNHKPLKIEITSLAVHGNTADVGLRATGYTLDSVVEGVSVKYELLESTDVAGAYVPSADAVQNTTGIWTLQGVTVVPTKFYRARLVIQVQ